MSNNQLQHFHESDFHNLLINRKEIEKVLDISIKLQTEAGYEYLDDYSMFPDLPLHTVICVFLDIHPEDINAWQHPRYQTIEQAIRNLIETKTLSEGVRINREYDDYYNEPREVIYLSHDVARALAKTYNLNWNVPAYKPVIVSHSNQNEDAQQIRHELDLAKKEIQQLKETLEQAQNQRIVDDESCAIYGHTTKEIKAIFATIKRYWINHDLSDSSTIATTEEIEAWLKQNYPAISEINRTAIQKITRPTEARNKGRRPK